MENSISMNKDDLFKKIDDMVIYEKDYQTILALLNYGDINFEVAIIEEVLKGNLYWSDLEQFLPHPEYNNLLQVNLKNQKQLSEILENISEFRKSTILNPGDLSVSEYNTTFQEKLFDIGIVPFDESDIWKKEYTRTRDSLIYNLLAFNPDDTDLQRSYKSRFLNYVENGRFILGNVINTDGQLFDSNGNQISTKPLTGSTITTSAGEFIYINPNDILFSVDKFIIPVDYKYQVLEPSDYKFMLDNNLTEDDMKKMKSTALFLRYDDFLGKSTYKLNKETNNGGE